MMLQLSSMIKTNFLRHISKIQSISEVQSQLIRLVRPQFDLKNSKVKAHIKNALDVSKSDLESKSISDSYSSIILPLSKDLKLREEYKSFAGKVRTARILEDLDTMAVYIAYKHNDRKEFLENEPFSPFAIVTAAVDIIKIHNYMDIDRDLRLSGNVEYVGSSSCCVNLALEQRSSDGESWDDILKALFIMVSRCPNSDRKVLMNPLNCTTEDEERKVNLCKSYLSDGKRRSEHSLQYKPPNENESKLIHNIHLNFSKSFNDGDFVLMSETVLKNAYVCEPQQRNIYNKIFGGYLMRSSYELAWANARIFAKTFPRIVIIGDVTFKLPVEIGSFLFFTSVIAYTNDEHHLVARVAAEVVDPSTRARKLTNTFYFLFETDEDLPQVIPETYTEYMTYVDGKRHYEQMINLKERQ